MFRMSGVPIPKPEPRLVEKWKDGAEWKNRDREGTEEARRRAKGRCEVTIAGVRCLRRDCETHHHIGGWKRRGRGASALARNKTRCCARCHPLITGKVLVHVAGNRYRHR
jgi:hypothetical protein